MTGSVRAYRNSVTEGATHIDILLACYDAVAEDIRLAGKFAAQGNASARCRHSERALLLIGHLESWISQLDDADLGASLAQFYQYLRAEILRLQLSSEMDKFTNLALVVCETRAVWQRKQSEGLSQPNASSHVSYSIGETDGVRSRFLASA
jgi:flagellin-specific chaperone FliS